ncbi:MAG: response regulator transcription factor [Verrucomicrobiae bacterium]
MKPITVLLAEDHSMVREGLRALLQLEADIQVAGEAENGREAVALAAKLSPDVTIMDIAMPLLNGLEAMRQILQAAPGRKVIMLTAHGDDAYVEKAMQLGASGFVIKQSESHILAEAIRTVHKGKQFFSPSISRRRIQQQRKAKAMGGQPRDHAARLSPREMEVLQLIAEGKANKETADELHISIKTVEKHRQSLMEKLNIHDTASLTRYAIASGVIDGGVQVTIL